LGTSLTDYGDEVTVDSSDKLYITGRTSGGLDNNKQEGNGDIFLGMYNSDGILL
tara:strand:+ start:644 stop:805 length:162 start_codon:yes stop_codon:yes gene_type:complete